MIEDTLTIGEVARRSNLRLSALRYYESKGLLPPARRVSGQRRYNQAVLLRLNIIRFAQQAGFSLAEIQVLLGESDCTTSELPNWHKLANRKLIETELIITQAQARKKLLEKSLDCRCTELESCELINSK